MDAIKKSANRPTLEGVTLETIVTRLSESMGWEAMAAQVFYHSRPLARALVKLTDLNHDAQPVAAQVTDGAGLVRLRRPPPGHWLLNVVWTTPLDGDEGIDYDTIFSSLSFGIDP